MQELLARAGERDLARLHHIGAGGDRKRHLGILLDEQNRGTRLVQLLHDLEDLLDEIGC